MTQRELEACVNAGLPEDVGAAINGIGRNPRPLDLVNAEGEPVTAKGVTFEVPKSRSTHAVRELRGRIPAGFLVFVSERNSGIGGKPDAVSIMAARNFIDVITAVGTAGPNYDITSEEVASRLKEWDRRYGLVLVGAGRDWFEAEFTRPPQDMQEFANEVYAFCPDVVTQGAETVDALADEMRGQNAVYLWWD